MCLWHGLLVVNGVLKKNSSSDLENNFWLSQITTSASRILWILWAVDNAESMIP